MSRFLYPHTWKISDKIEVIINTYKHIEDGARLLDTNVSLIGRIILKRPSSKKLNFYTIIIDGVEFQIISDLNSFRLEKDYYEIHDQTKLGDVVGVNGYIGKGKRGELSIFPREMVILSPCIPEIPTKSGLEDKELRYSNRYIDLIVNKDIRPIFIKRHKIIKFLRDYLCDRDFIEVETPVLSNMAGGATARPFKTFHNAMKQEMFMRIAPELFLKQLVIGGLSKVFEIGKQFRNEDIDTTHNPEFTSCELY
jgi:lysyl-tRNA synthetase class 2